MGLWGSFKRRAWKGAVIEAINAKYEINLRAETDYFSSPTLDDILDKLYEPIAEANVGGPGSTIAGVLALEHILDERGLNLAARAQTRKLDRMMRDRR
jgi:hypothetical protein